MACNYPIPIDLAPNGILSGAKSIGIINIPLRLKKILESQPIAKMFEKNMNTLQSIAHFFVVLTTFEECVGEWVVCSSNLMVPLPLEKKIKTVYFFSDSDSDWSLFLAVGTRNRNEK